MLTTIGDDLTQEGEGTSVGVGFSCPQGSFLLSILSVLE